MGNASTSAAIAFIVVAIVVTLYFILFRSSGSIIMPEELSGIKKRAMELFIPDPMDSEHIVLAKKKLEEEFVIAAPYFSRNPPKYSKQEAEALRKMNADARQFLLEIVAGLKEQKPLLDNAILANEEALSKARNLMKMQFKGDDDDDDGDDDIENVKDIIERQIESHEAKISKYKEEKKKLEHSIAKYSSI